MIRRTLIVLLLFSPMLPAQEEWTEADVEEAVEIATLAADSRQAAEAGDAAAQLLLARCYLTGSGVTKSTDKGLYWVRKAADQGHADAQCLLAECYKKGQGVERNDTEACRWWVKAAHQGNLEGMYRLGMAHLSGDANMIEAFREGDDIHASTAAKVYKIGIDEVTREQRSKAKTANFGIIYGISVFGLAERMNVPRAEAKELIDGYFETYPQVKEYMDKSIALARENGYIETVFGRKRYLPDINSHNAVVRGYAERNAINAPIQGSAADIIKVAMVNIYRRFMAENIRSKMMLQVHDELNFSVYPDEKAKVQQIVIEEMEKAYAMQVPLRADCGWGKNWLEAH